MITLCVIPAVHHLWMFAVPAGDTSSMMEVPHERVHVPQKYLLEMFSCILDPELPRGTVVGIDLLNIPPLDGAHFLSSHDVTDPATHAKLLELLPGGQAHVILSDMAPNASGFREMDHEKLIAMCLSLVDLAEKILQPGGSLVCKYWDGILAHKLQEKLAGVFSSVRTLKPNASRKDSAERYFYARVYRKPIK